jgi:hypothetical protein
MTASNNSVHAYHYCSYGNLPDFKSLLRLLKGFAHKILVGIKFHGRKAKSLKRKAKSLKLKADSLQRTARGCG